MTRQEFLEASEDCGWSDLVEFCNNEGCDYCDDVYDEYDRNEYVDERLVEDARECGNWQEFKDILNSIPTGYDCYRRNDYGEWVGLGDDDLSQYIEDVIEWMDRNDQWDEEEFDDGEDDTCDDNDYDEEEDLTPIEYEDISMSELLTACNRGLKSIGDANAAAEQADKDNFDEFVAEIKGTVTVNVKLKQ